MALIDAVKYLVLERVSRVDDALNALADYINGLSPVELARKYNLPKDAVRGIWIRVLEKCGSSQKARALVRYAVPLLMSIDPIVRKNGNTIECTLCGETFLAHKHVNMAMANHVRAFHWNYVEKTSEKIIEKLREVVLNNNKKQI
jgi:hypothetical protein